ncbi:MAG: energy-coupling factor ABC transporter ATP-binding protein [Lachnotalea sp.]
MTQSILKMENGSFSYEEGRDAIHNINLEINPGEKIAIIGNNGAGKSTFFLALNGVIHLQKGSIYFHGEQIDYKRKSLMELRKKVGMVFQNPDDQIIASTVEGEISFGLFNIGMKKEEVRKRVDVIMEELNLTKYSNRPPHFLSGGEKKRVTIADIVVMEPEMILFDEPTASLDNKNIQIFKEQMVRLHQQGVTLVVSTHDMNFVWEWADRVIVFSEGEVIADDIPNSIFSNEDIVEKAALQKPILFEFNNRGR